MAACSRFAVSRTRPADWVTVPSISASTFSSRPIWGTGFVVRLYRITEVREMTRSPGTLPSCVISSSVMPSAKYSWLGSPERFSSGSTAMEAIRGGGPRSDSRTQVQAKTTATMASAAAAPAHHHFRRGGLGGAGISTSRRDTLASSTGAIKR